MKRLVDYHLVQWKKQKGRKPLLLRGARQVGKTYATRKLGESFSNFIEINFELTRDAAKIFEKDLDPKRIVQEIGLLSGKKVVPGKTLLFFDEIQECPNAIRALRYFFEMMPEQHVVAAGSLIDFALEEVGMPVGRVSNFYLYPLSFIEFLSGLKETLLLEKLIGHKSTEPMPEVAHNKLMDLVGQYLAIGGMPEAVMRWIYSKDPKESFSVHHDLIEAYKQDFNKYTKKHEVKYVDRLFSQVPYLIGQQFQYKNVEGEYRKRELAPSLDLLCHANVVHKVHHSSGGGIPLGAEVNPAWFKVFFLDIALCQAILGFDLSTWFLEPNAQFVNRGMIAEAFIGQELLCYSCPSRKAELYFWRRAEKSSSAEVDFLYDYKSQVVPIEVKSGTIGKLKSMHTFLDKHPKSPFGIRFSAQNYSLYGKIDSRPLYAALSLAHQEQKEAFEHLI